MMVVFNLEPHEKWNPLSISMVYLLRGLSTMGVHISFNNATPQFLSKNYAHFKDILIPLYSKCCKYICSTRL